MNLVEIIMYVAKKVTLVPAEQMGKVCLQAN